MSWRLLPIARHIGLGILLVLATPLTMSQSMDTLPDILQANNATVRLPNFSYAGYNNGMGQPPILEGSVVDVGEYGAVANDGLDDSAAFLRALTAAQDVEGPVIVKMPAGRFVISEILRIQRSNIVLRGAGGGSEGTELFFPRPLRMIDKGESLAELNAYLRHYDKRQREPKNNLDELFSEYSWSGGFLWVQKEGTRAAPYLLENDPEINSLADVLSGTAGTNRVKVDARHRLRIGDVVELQWFNRQGEEGPFIEELYGKTDVAIGSHHWTFSDRPLVRQKTRITEINGNEVTISDPLLHEISETLTAQFAEWDHLTNVGIEDVHLVFPEAPSFGHHMEQGYNGIYLTSVYDGWIRGLRITNADSGVLSYNSGNITVADITTLGTRTAHYAVHAGNVHNMLVRDIMIHNPVRHSLSLNTQSTKCVFLNAHIFNAAVLDQHAGANHQNLFDNVTMHVHAKRDGKGPYYEVWNGSGAGYWQPGHGRYNTTWNLKVRVVDGADRTETVRLLGVAEGPDARLIGISGNRKFELNYFPRPYVERLNAPMHDVPSLYVWQLERRK